jgi:hypothetical protein
MWHLLQETKKKLKMFGNNKEIVKMKIIKRDSQEESSFFWDVTQCNIPEDGRSHLHCSGNLKS